MTEERLSAVSTVQVIKKKGERERERAYKNWENKREQEQTWRATKSGNGGGGQTEWMCSVFCSVLWSEEGEESGKERKRKKSCDCQDQVAMLLRWWLWFNKWLLLAYKKKGENCCYYFLWLLMSEQNDQLEFNFWKKVVEKVLTF